MNSNIVQQLKQLERFGFYSQDSVRQNGAEIQTALTASSMKVLEFLAESEDRSVKAAVTMNPFCTSAKIRNFISEILDRGEFNDRDINFMKLVIRNPRCPGDIMDDIVGNLAKHNSFRYEDLKEVLELPNFENCTLLRLMDDYEWIAPHVAMWTTRQEIWMYCPDEFIVYNPNCPTELLESIAERHPYDARIEMAVANHPNAGEKTLQTLAEHATKSSGYGKYLDHLQGIVNALIWNPNTTQEILLMLWRHFERTNIAVWNARKHKNFPQIIE